MGTTPPPSTAIRRTLARMDAPWCRRSASTTAQGPAGHVHATSRVDVICPRRTDPTPPPRSQQVSQTQEMFEDGGSGESRVRVQRRLGDKARTVTKTRDAEGKEHTTDQTYGMTDGAFPRARALPRPTTDTPRGGAQTSGPPSTSAGAKPRPRSTPSATLPARKERWAVAPSRSSAPGASPRSGAKVVGQPHSSTGRGADATV